jgi:hypothetical protein
MLFTMDGYRHVDANAYILGMNGKNSCKMNMREIML